MSLGEVIASKARAAGMLPLAFTVYVVVKPAELRDSQAEGESIPPVLVLSNEITSNLESLNYVERVSVCFQRT